MARLWAGLWVTALCSLAGACSLTGPALARPVPPGAQASPGSERPADIGAGVDRASRAPLAARTTTPTRRRQHQLASNRLVELSGLAASRRQAGVFWAINDSGNPAALHALAADGSALGWWPVEARNHDWEAMAWIPGEPDDYLLIGDLGDNREQRNEYRILRIAEPDLNRSPAQALPAPDTLPFRYPDGPHDAEAMVVDRSRLLIFTKASPMGGSPRPSRVYALALDWSGGPVLREARFLGVLPARSPTLEARLAARFADIDLLQPTAADIDPATGRLFLLSYRDVRQMVLPTANTAVSGGLSDWPEHPDLSTLGTHDLPQAEALAFSPEGWLLIGSEGLSGELLQWPLPEPDSELGPDS